MLSRSKIIIVGSTGYIGKCLIQYRSRQFDVMGTASVSDNKQTLSLQLEFYEQFDYEIISSSDVVLMLAAISSPDICENDNTFARKVNVTGTSEFIARVMERGGRIIFFSSDTVYGEQDDNFDEFATCNPAGKYAEMKHEVEKYFLNNLLFKSIRLSYVFSHEDKFTKYLKVCAERGEEVEIFHPFYRAIVHRDDVVQGAIALAQRWDEFPQHIINFGGPDVLDRIEFVQILKDTIYPGLRFHLTEPTPEFFNNRPRVIRMTSPILPALLGRPAHTLREAAMIELNLNKEDHE